MNRLIASLILLLASSARAAEPLTLGAWVRAALERSPSLAAAAARSRGAEAGLRQAEASRWPGLSARASYVRSDNPVFVFGSLLTQGRFGAADFALDRLNHPGWLGNLNAGLELGVPVYTGGAIETQRSLGRLGVEASEAAGQAAVQGVRYQAVDAWLRSLSSAERLRELDERLASAEKEMAEAEDLKRKGLVLGSDFYAARAILGSLKAWRVQLQAERSAHLARLGLLSGRDAQAQPPSGGLRPSSYGVEASSELVREALSSRRELQAAGLRESAAKLEREQVERHYLPTVQAFAAYEANTGDFSTLPFNGLVGLRAGVAIGDAGYGARRDRAAAEEDAARRDRQSMEEGVRMEVAQLYESYRGAEAGLAELKATAEQAERSLELFRPLYREGRQSVLEVLRAEEGLAKARGAYQDALLGLHLGYARLMLAAGRLDDAGVSQIEARVEARP